ncbi:peptidase [Fulvimarina endophytica]|uniref:Peptidase n=1 Tax=Fulvimarina endophytica TaxID=2293836 RepID=A0A371X6W1_9HYPH|nr:prepilin peptidase [Fulvimarina endophytica]RFC64982.1 peptidase [Fulvimarina endophytica]
MSLAYLFLVFYFAACLSAAAVSDILTMTIPNRLCLLLAAGFPLAAYLSGMSLETAALHMAFGLAAFVMGFALFALNVFGGGDAKLMAATAFWIGPEAALPFVFDATIVGGIMAIAMIYVRSIAVPATGIVFADRLLSRETGIPFGVALAFAGLHAYAQGPFLDAALRF